MRAYQLSKLAVGLALTTMALASSLNPAWILSPESVPPAAALGGILTFDAVVYFVWGKS